MRKSGGAAIPMQKNSSSREGKDILKSIQYFVGDALMLQNMASVPARRPFDDEVIRFVNEVSRTLMGKKEARAYPDIVTLGFWMRKASVLNLKQRFERKDGDLHLGRGVVFHIAPSNVPMAFALSFTDHKKPAHIMQPVEEINIG